jgi:hypothetical protein
MKMNKRGMEILHESIFTLIILSFIFISLLFFIGQQQDGKLAEKQILAKEICLMTLASNPGTIITIEHNPSLIIEKQENGIFVSDAKGLIMRGYFYDCYGNFEVNSLEDGKTEFKIK